MTEEKGQLHDLGLQENFIENPFVMNRWRETLASGKTARNLVEFHSRHKYLIMSHSVEGYRKMGKLVARSGDIEADTLYRDYLEMLQKSLRLEATVPKHFNVLQHIFGYFKKQLSADEKQEVLSIIEDYRARKVPLIVPITLLNHLARKYQQPYLQQQVYLNPHLIDLGLSNHV